MSSQRASAVDPLLCRYLDYPGGGGNGTSFLFVEHVSSPPSSAGKPSESSSQQLFNLNRLHATHASSFVCLIVPRSLGRSVRASCDSVAVCGCNMLTTGTKLNRMDVTQFLCLLHLISFSLSLHLSSSSPSLCNQCEIIIFTIMPPLPPPLTLSLSLTHSHSSLIFCGLLSSGHS